MKVNAYDREITAIYDDWVNSGYYDYPKVVEILSDLLGKFTKILELGIGTGNISIPLAKKRFKVDGIDPSRFMLKVLKDKLKSNPFKINYFQQEVENLSLKNKYDAAFSFGSPFWAVAIGKTYYFDSYLKDKMNFEKSLKNVYGVLKKNGLLFLNIQHHGASFKMSLRNGIDYHFIIEEKDRNHIIKTHYFEKDGKPLFNRAYPMFRLTEKEALKMFKDQGFINKGQDKTKTFWIFKKA